MSCLTGRLLCILVNKDFYSEVTLPDNFNDKADQILNNPWNLKYAMAEILNGKTVLSR